jgi:hypothetical protein
MDLPPLILFFREPVIIMKPVLVYVFVASVNFGVQGAPAEAFQLASMRL